MNKISSQDERNLLRIAAALPKGDDARRAILAGLSKLAADKLPQGYLIKKTADLDKELVKFLVKSGIQKGKECRIWDTRSYGPEYKKMLDLVDWKTDTSIGDLKAKAGTYEGVHFVHVVDGNQKYIVLDYKPYIELMESVNNPKPSGAPEGGPDPKKKYDLMSYLDGQEPKPWKKGLAPSAAAALAKKQFDLRDKIDAAEGDDAKVDKLTAQLEGMGLGVETFLELQDPDSKSVWTYTDSGWELQK